MFYACSVRNTSSSHGVGVTAGNCACLLQLASPSEKTQAHHGIPAISITPQHNNSDADCVNLQPLSACVSSSFLNASHSMVTRGLLLDSMLNVQTYVLLLFQA
jgi:hypothetical protein